MGRNSYFTYSDSNFDQYDGLEKMVWKVRDNMMLNATAYPENANFNTEIDGTANMSAVLNAPILYTGGQFYRISQEYQNSGVTALLFDSYMNKLIPNEENDGTRLGIE